MGKRKLWNRPSRKQKDFDRQYTVGQAIERKVDKWGAEIQATMDAAEAEGKHGVMIVLEEQQVFICDMVPFGKVWRAGSMEAVDKLRDRLQVVKPVETEDVVRDI